MIIVVALLSFLCVLETGAQDPNELLAIEELADKNFINRYNSWEHPYYYFMPINRHGRQLTAEEEAESKSLPIMQVPLTLSNPFVSIIERANKFYRMIRNNGAVKSKSPSKQYLIA
ncbi:hypothetical protein M3Y97_00846200 [Aphelenchoides bicaudatus]|nr:hypothetical protein M3Y97_00846200 [Aphelenchoides bicaudatus]